MDCVSTQEFIIFSFLVLVLFIHFWSLSHSFLSVAFNFELFRLPSTSHSEGLGVSVRFRLAAITPGGVNWQPDSLF